ncbi:glycoside hydrolase family 16 protein [Hebeloma cylindrosporum]|uniref:Glycoside hydrolase family 16 protein n=1 Tax=Hebeloma cylindrosporum TaxID=76867 RepID=A0A0C3CMY4_HEBCY|nr:glycoside hydrolase family 16 protein [Hebeloma cylindrosporum h7]
MTYYHASSIIFLLLASVVDAGINALEARQTTCQLHTIPGISGGFRDREFVDFSTVKAGEGDVRSFLSNYGITLSNYPVSSTPVAHDFLASNVAFGDGALNLKVNAFTGSSVHSSEIITTDKLKYASVRTVLKSSPVLDIVEGNFFYLNDTQEIDWEILTSTVSKSSACVPAGIWATNQAVIPGQPSTHDIVEVSFDPSADFHEYRIDWTPGVSAFYIDGVQKAKLTTNVPTNDGYWIWNAWSSGDPCWSNGPPVADSVTQIRSIEIFKGYSEVVGNATSDCVSGTSLVPQVALSPSSAIEKSGAVQTVTWNSIRLLLLAGIINSLPWLMDVICTHIP